MRKMTLLEMTQNILSALDSDEVNSISDTVESLQVAEVIKETFYEQFNNIFVPEFQGLVRLTDVNDITCPNYLKAPSNLSKIEWIKYQDHRADDIYHYVSYYLPEEFLERTLSYTGGYGLTQVLDPSSGIAYYVRNDGPPTCFTMFDDNHIAFDSYDLEYETTLHSARSLAYGLKSFEFELDDDFVPPLDPSLFPLLLAEAKSVCFINLKQISSSKEEQRARRQRIRMQNDQHKSRAAQYAYWNRGPNYSRHR